MRIRTHTNPFNYFARMQPIDFESLFTNFKGIFDLEVGFGRGLFIQDYATRHPDRPIVGVEVRKNVVEVLQKRIDVAGLKNVHLIHGNAQIALEDVVPDASVANCFVFHPDPWFKKSHRKRRVINQKFLKILSQKMTRNGLLYLSTDVEGLWNDMQETLTESGLFTPIDTPEFWENHYKTNWQRWSVEDQRTSYFGTFECQN